MKCGKYSSGAVGSISLVKKEEEKKGKASINGNQRLLGKMDTET